MGSAFDPWFLNLFPRENPFVANVGGYLTLSFIPTLGTMILGLLAGGWLRRLVLRAARRVLIRLRKSPDDFFHSLFEKKISIKDATSGV